MATGPGWGSGFQRRLDALKLTPTQLEAVRKSWAMIPTTISGALKKDAVGQWKYGVLAHFADVESRSKKLRKSLLSTFSGPGAAMVLGYGAYAVGRNAAVAGAERDRAYLRLNQAGIPEGDKVRYADESERLAVKYPSMSMTDILELALRTQSTMGDTDRTIAVLEALVKGQTTLMSARSPDAAVDTLDRIVKAGDVLGQNAEGPKGIANMIQLIDGLIRAAQVEGLDFDPGSILEFARRSKVAGAGWSTEFISAIGPAIMQDMGGAQSGNALAMAFKSFVLGDNSMNGKVYRGRQVDMGLRKTPDGAMVGEELMTENPYEWAQQYLLPALEKAGVDVNDDGAVTRAVGKLSGNSNATGQLTRFITQREQYAKSIAAYQRAMGIDGADDVLAKDPFVAWAGIKNSFSNFTGAIAENVEIITPGLNAITGAINRFAVSVRENPLQSLGLGGLALGAAGVGTWKIAAGIAGLVTAGPSLQTAAVMLQQAAVSLGGAKGLDDLGDGKKPPRLGRGPIDRFLNFAFSIEKPEIFPLSPEILARQVAQPPSSFFGGVPGSPDFTAPSPSGGMENSPMNTGIFPDDLDALETKATATGAALGTLNGSVAPQVDTASLEAAMAVVNQLSAALQRLGGYSRAAGAKVQSEINATYSDMGVAP